MLVWGCSVVVWMMEGIWFELAWLVGRKSVRWSMWLVSRIVVHWLLVVGSVSEVMDLLLVACSVRRRWVSWSVWWKALLDGGS